MTNNNDYWLRPPGPEDAGVTASARGMTVEAINGVEPLDAQFGVAEPLTVPPALREALFGQPESTEGRATRPLHTYAVLDAAKVLGLPDMLETSGLEHACLFAGDAADELRDVAPWLVRLEEGDPFTRGLFTRGDAPWQMWDSEPGIFLRSQGSLDDLRKHLRKFTKVRARNEKWYYFRFWEPMCLEGLLREGHGDTGQRLLAAASVLILNKTEGVFSIFRAPARAPAQSTGVFRLHDEDLAALSAVSVRHFAQRIAAWLIETHGPRGDQDDVFRFAYQHVLRARKVLGLRDERSVSEYVAACWLLGAPIEMRYELAPGAASQVAQIHQLLAQESKARAVGGGIE